MAAAASPGTPSPAPDALPSGWAIASNRVFVDNLTTSLVGPTPSGSAQGPAVFVSVSCYGSDAQLALTRGREVAQAAGATNVSFPSLGDQTVAVRNSTAGTTIIYMRRGLLVADLTAPATLDQSTLEALAKTVDAAMTAALTSTPAPAPATGSSAVGSEPPTLPPTASAVAESHVVPDLEARLPHTVKGTTLSVQSVSGTTALKNDATSQALTASLSRLGNTPADLQIAAAHDPSGTLPLYLFAFRVSGVSTADLGKALIESWSASASPAPTSSQLTIGGRKVTKVTISQSPPEYLWEETGSSSTSRRPTRASSPPCLPSSSEDVPVRTFQ